MSTQVQSFKERSRVSFQESRTLGPTSKIRGIYKLDQLEFTVTEAPACDRGIFSTEMPGLNGAEVSNWGVRERDY